MSSEKYSQARIGDEFKIYCPHGGSGEIMTGALFSKCEGKPIARVGDTGMCRVCGQIFTIVTNAEITATEGRLNARVGDMLTGVCNKGIPHCCSHDVQGQIVEGADITKTPK